jgi:hypothetical protein
VGFLVNEQRLAVFDVRTATLSATLVLVNTDRYPGSEEALNIALADVER